MNSILILIIFLFIIIMSCCYFMSICLGAIYYIKKKGDNDDICDTEDSNDLFILFLHRLLSIPVYIMNLSSELDHRDITESDLLSAITDLYANREEDFIPPFMVNPEVFKPEIITRLTIWMNQRRIVSYTDQQELARLRDEKNEILIESLDCSNEIKNNEIRSKVRNCLNLYIDTYGDNQWITQITNDADDPYNIILPINCPSS